MAEDGISCVFGGKFGVWFGDADKGDVLAMWKVPQETGNVVVGEAGNREPKGRLGVSVRLLVRSCERIASVLNIPIVIIAATANRI